MRNRLKIGTIMFVAGISMLVLSYTIDRSIVSILISVLASVMWITGMNISTQALDYLIKEKKEKRSSHLPPEKDNEREENSPS